MSGNQPLTHAEFQAYCSQAAREINWKHFRQPRLDAKDMRRVLRQTSYEVSWDMVVRHFRCLRTGVQVNINGNRHKRGQATKIARAMLFKGRFQIAIQREML